MDINIYSAFLPHDDRDAAVGFYCDKLGFELRDTKSPHWTGSRNSPRTFGHFGASGTFLWVDPHARLACACLTALEFGPWAVEAWPRLADAVLAGAVG